MTFTLNNNRHIATLHMGLSLGVALLGLVLTA